jgi:L-arabinokinase
VSVFFYISGHGFGHASRQIEIINGLGARRPDVDIVVRTSASRWLFDRTARVPFTLVGGECDTGVVQLDSLRLDEAGSIERAVRFHATLDARAELEAALLRHRHARLVIADAPALGCAAAARAGVPSVVAANFTWDWIYEEYGEHETRDLVLAIQRAYRAADSAWRLPMHGGFETFDRVVDVPFVARHARYAPEAVRHALGLPPDRRLALASFGGYGVSDLALPSLDCLNDYGVVLTHGGADTPPQGVTQGISVVNESALYGAGLRYEDLVAAVDIVMTKPGYGIIAECLANDTALVYTSRGRFREYGVLVDAMPRYLRCHYIEQDALRAGRWRTTLDEVMRQPAPDERPATNGADVVVDLIQDRL